MGLRDAPGSATTRGAAFFFLLTMVAPTFAGATDVYIDVTRKRAERIKIAVPEYVYKKGVGPDDDMQAKGGQAKDIMEFDLQFSGYFSVLKDDAVMNEITRKEARTGKLEWGLWRQGGVDLLVRGSYATGQNGTMLVESTLNDVPRSEQLAGVRYSGARELFRKMVHKFADQVVYRFTGETGVADTRVSFTSRVAGGKELFLCDYDGQNVKQLTTVKSIIISPRWSPGGSELLFTSFHKRIPAAFWLDLRSGHVRQVVPNTKNMNSASSWAPDGKSIVFTMSERGNFDIYRISADGTGLKRLTTSNAIDTSPSYSPNGKSIVFLSDRTGKPQLFIMDADGSNQKRFTYNGDYNADPAWSPKGDKIAYSAMTGDNFNIMVKSLDGSIEKQLTANAGKNESPSWSPDGRHLVFTSTRTGMRQLYIMNASGENQVQITNMPNGAFGASWAPRQ